MLASHRWKAPPSTTTSAGRSLCQYKATLHGLDSPHFILWQVAPGQPALVLARPPYSPLLRQNGTCSVHRSRPAGSGASLQTNSSEALVQMRWPPMQLVPCDSMLQASAPVSSESSFGVAPMVLCVPEIPSVGPAPNQLQVLCETLINACACGWSS